MPFAEVAVFSGRPQRQTFTYAIPPSIDLRVGHAVFVPFGRQTLQGVVLALTDKSEIAEPRNVLALIDPERLITVEQAALVRWMADSYLAPVAAVVSLFLPPGFARKPQRMLKAAAVPDASALQPLSERERRVLDAVASKPEIEADALKRALNDGNVGATIRALVDKRLIDERFTLSRPAVAPRSEVLLALAVDRPAARAAIDTWPRSRRSRQADLLERLRAGPLSATEARRIAGSRVSLDRWIERRAFLAADDEGVRLRADDAATDAAIASLRRTAAERHQVATLETLLANAEAAPKQREAVVRGETDASREDIDLLVDAGLVRRETRSVQRDPLAARSVPALLAPILTSDQARAYRAVADALDRARAAKADGRRDGSIFLLHGVTGSGKTEVYLAAAQYARELGGRSVVLVPEIALTPQTVDRFLARFPGRVALRHSGLTPGEAHDQWHNTRAGQADVVVGSRSALFAPQPDLALIIVDEEHEWTYKQSDPVPRYHVREVVEEYCRLTGAVAVFGSATPDVVTAARARAGRYTQLDLPQRVHRLRSDDPTSAVQPSPLPAVDIVDMREELTRGNRSIFSAALSNAMDKALQAGEQVMLFLNRRGAAMIVCRTCGDAISCDRCSVPFTYHSFNDTLRCHECGNTAFPRTRCPNCESDRIRPMGLGTQRLEEEVSKAFPLARPLRWDRDTVTGKDGHRELLERFVRGDANVLVGTQMIAKGLDLPQVTVVGVVNADLSLRLPDYTGPERTFQLVTQMAGRAGRGTRAGHVVVQTYAPDHYAITTAAAHDYESFYEAEMRARAEHDYPPYGRLARLVYADRKLDRARDVAETMAASLVEDRDRRGLVGPEILGPTPAFISRRRGLYRWQVTLRGADPLPLLRPIDFGRGWTVDVDPISLL